MYLELTAEALAAGRSVIVLVPEITLTPQTVGQFQTAFGDQVLASHSKLTEASRHRIWAAAMAATEAGQPRVIVGPRSCLFMPLHNLGLIIIDESHESTYKQEQPPRYQAATVAAKRARDTGARLLLGSATPGLQELFLAQQGLLEHIKLTRRVNEIPHSQAEIIDLRSLLPLDLDTITDSVKKTGRCVIAHEATRTCGFGAELAALVQEHCFYHLEAPIVRVTGWDTPYPHALEWAYFPGPARVADGLRRALEG